MSLTVRELCDALQTSQRELSAQSVVLATRLRAGSDQIQLQEIGEIRLLGGGKRIVLFPSRFSAEDCRTALSVNDMLERLRSLDDSANTDAIEWVHDIVEMPNGDEGIDYGGAAVEDAIWSNDRSEVWLLAGISVFFPVGHPSYEILTAQ